MTGFTLALIYAHLLVISVYVYTYTHLFILPIYMYVQSLLRNVHNLKNTDIHLGCVVLTYVKKFFNWYFFSERNISPKNIGSVNSPNYVSQFQTEETIFRGRFKTVASLIAFSWIDQLQTDWSEGATSLSWLVFNQESNYVHRQVKCEWWEEPIPSLSFSFSLSVL